MAQRREAWASPPAGTVTFLFTDIEGSTKLWEAHPQAMALALARHDQILREAIGAQGGFVFKTVGDAFCAAFATAPRAFEAVLAAQRSLAEEPWPEETPIRVRMALHTGAAESRDDDYFGPPLNRVARLLATAHGGQSLVSQATYELIRDSLPAGADLLDLGSHLLKDLSRPERVFQLRHPALRFDFPALRSLSNQPNNLPLQLSSFVGREEETAQVKQILERHRLVTLTGTGGSGKTRLGIQVAAEVIGDFPDGAWLVELAPLGDAENLARTVADVLTVPEGQDQDLTRAIAEHIGSKSILLILDNCEHLIEECARLADALLRSCPSVRILATSREPLGIAGESTLRVPPLALPNPATTQTSSTLAQFAAVRLFIDRALQADPSFAVTNENAPALASVCWQLDGIPLAIELAAARVRTLPIEQIEARLEKRFLFLTGGSRVALPRQQTLRALIDWSYELLQPAERSVLNRLSVFSGGWTLDASEAVCADGEVEGWMVGETVLALVDKSLVVTHEDSGASRYSLLESIRQFARERLLESQAQADAEARHLAYFAALAEEARTRLRGPDQKEWLRRLRPEVDNFRAALRFGVGKEEGLALAGNLWWLWYLNGHFSEARSFLAAALESTPDTPSAARANALDGAGVLAECQGDMEFALECHRRGLAICRERGDLWNLGRSLNNLGNVYGMQGNFDAAEPYWLQALGAWREMEAAGTLKDYLGIAAVLDNLGNVARSRGHLREALDLYSQGLALRRKSGNQGLAAYSLINLGSLTTAMGDPDAAIAHFRAGLEISFEMADRLAIQYFLEGLACFAPPEEAAKLLGRAERLREELAIPMTADEVVEHDALVATVSGALPQPMFDAAWAQGREMELGEAVRIARQAVA